MSFLVLLPNDVLFHVLQSFCDLQDANSLDTAFCNCKERNAMLTVLNDGVLSIRCGNRKFSTLCMSWIFRRQIKLSHISLNSPDSFFDKFGRLFYSINLSKLESLHVANTPETSVSYLLKYSCSSGINTNGNNLNASTNQIKSLRIITNIQSSGQLLFDTIMTHCPNLVELYIGCNQSPTISVVANIFKHCQNMMDCYVFGPFHANFIGLSVSSYAPHQPNTLKENIASNIKNKRNNRYAIKLSNIKITTEEEINFIKSFTIVSLSLDNVTTTTNSNDILSTILDNQQKLVILVIAACDNILNFTGMRHVLNSCVNLNILELTHCSLTNNELITLFNNTSHNLMEIDIMYSSIIDNETAVKIFQHNKHNLALFKLYSCEHISAPQLEALETSCFEIDPY